MTGVFCFDMFVREVRNLGIVVSMQYHDEVLFSIPEGMENTYREKLESAIQTVNRKLKLNVPLGVSMLFGKDYAEVH